MGDAGASSARGPQAIYWNPGLNAWAERFAATFSYSAWFLDMSKSGLFAVRPTPLFNIGLGLTTFSAGKLENREDRPTDEPVGYYYPADYSIYLSLSRILGPKVAMGLTGRYYYQQILDRNASGIGADFGLVFLPLERMKVGVAIQDFGTSLKFKLMEHNLPSRGTAGVSYLLPLGRSELTGAADFGYSFYDRHVMLNTGAEFVLNHVLALRAGYRALNQDRGVTAGLGLRIKGFRLEYSFGLHDNDLDATHRFALGFGY